MDSDNKFIVWLTSIGLAATLLICTGISVDDCIKRRENRAAVERCIEKTQNLDKCAEIFHTKGN